MPNWCEGNIRFRGTKENIKNFMKNEIVCFRIKDGESEEEKPDVTKDTDYCLKIQVPKNCSEWFYVRGTRRNFFEVTSIEAWFDSLEGDEKEIIVCLDGFRVAWSFEQCDAWKEIARKYNFDVKMTGYERGMLFSQVKTVFRDGSMKDDVHEYESSADWMWNCPQPNLGG